MMKNNRKVAQKSTASTEKARLSLYTSSGIEIAEIEWENKRVAGMGWSDREELVVVSEDGE